MKYFLIAGEASGDIHAAQLIKELKQQDKDASFGFLGGDLMEQAAGCKPIIHYKDMAYMGFIEVIKHLQEILGFMRTAENHISGERPDAVILIDYPSFNLKVAKYAFEAGVPVFYFISPKVWAWKEYRVNDIKRYVKEVYSILPFETKFYATHNYRVEYVGNPTVKEIADAQRNFMGELNFRNKYNLDPGMPIIAVVPGSRRKEIVNNLPEMLLAARTFADHQTVIAAAPNIAPSLYEGIINSIATGDQPPVIHNDTFQLIHSARAALVTSGTASLETAVLGTPQVVCYRLNGSRILRAIYPIAIHTKYISLPNLINDAPVVDELILDQSNWKNIASHLRPLLNDSPQRSAMLKGYAEMMRRLGTTDCAALAASRLISRINHDAKFENSSQQ
jgi:lipid-A-disaccharide synthase